MGIGGLLGMGGGGVEGAPAASWGAGMEQVTEEVGISHCAILIGKK